MKARLARLRRRVRKLTTYIRKRARKGLRSPVAVKLRKAARKRAKAIKKRLASLRVDWNGYPPLRNKRLRRAVRIASRYGLVVTSTTGGTHSPTSWHYKGRAVDLASGSVTQMKRAQGAIERELGRTNCLELFGPAAWYVKNGARYRGAFPDHGDHVHIAA